jgi:hypothetical protein
VLGECSRTGAFFLTSSRRRARTPVAEARRHAHHVLENHLPRITGDASSTGDEQNAAPRSNLPAPSPAQPIFEAPQTFGMP